jgi:hypothetical protein
MLSPVNKKFLAWLGGIAAVIGVLGSFYGITKYIVHSETEQVRTDIATMRSDIARLKDDTLQNHNDIVRVDSRINDQFTKALDRVAGDVKVKPTKDSLEKSQEIIRLASTIGATIDPVTLAKYGTAITAASADVQLVSVAGKTLQQAADYRSFLNKDFIPSLKNLTPWRDSQYRTSLFFKPTPNTEGIAATIYFAGGKADSEHSARLEFLSNPQTVPSETGLFVVNGGLDAIMLDGMYMKNVIIRNAAIFYGGGKVRLENVTFVNCTFSFITNKPTFKLGDAILQAAQVTFSNTLS